jgi:hypothetical protein
MFMLTPCFGEYGRAAWSKYLRHAKERERQNGEIIFQI